MTFGGVARTFRHVFFTGTRGAAAVAQTVVARFLVVGINVITGIITARGLGPAGRGEQSAIVLWPGLLAYLLTLGLPAAIRYWVRREPERRHELLTVSLIVATVTSILAAGIGFVFIPDWLHHYSPDVIRMAQILMVTAPEVMIALMLTAMLEALGRFRSANASRYLPVGITLIALVVLALRHELTPFTVAVAYTAPPVLAAFLMLWLLRDSIHFSGFDPRPALRMLGAYGLRSYGIDVLSTVGQQIDQVLVVALLNPSDVGIYVVALNASRVVNVLHAAVVTVVFPSTAGLEREQVLAIVGRSARISSAIAAAFGLVLVLLYPLLIPLFYGGAFEAGIVVAQLLTLEAILVGLVSVLSQAFMSLGRPGFVTILQLLGLAIVVPAMFILLPRFGLVGAALALLASTVTRLIFILIAFPVTLHLPIPKMLPNRADFQHVRQALAR
jgi:enterobacterial common antigen flippase